MPMATLRGFRGSWGSGLGFLLLDDVDGNRKEVPCDNGHTVRSLDAMTGGRFIAEGHTVDSSALDGLEVVYVMDDMGLTLGGMGLREDAEENGAEVCEKCDGRGCDECSQLGMVAPKHE